MHFTTVALAVTGLAASAAAAPAPQAGNYPYFRAQARGLNGPSKFDGLYVTTLHTGAGESAPALTKRFKLATQFQYYNLSYVTMPVVSSEVEYYFLNLDTARPTSHSSDGTAAYAAPKGYLTTDVNLGDARTPDFVNTPVNRTGLTGTLGYAGTAHKFASWAVCDVSNVYVYDNSTIPILLWRRKGIKPDTTGQCVDVALIYTDES